MLDETRTLILGAQILLGFQYQGVFQERFGALPPHARAMDSWALGIMLLTMWLILLVIPAALRRIVRGSEDSEGLLRTGEQLCCRLLSV